MSAPYQTIEELRLRAGRLPRVKVAHLPSSVRGGAAFRFSNWRRASFVKRDDCTGLLLAATKSAMPNSCWATPFSNDATFWSGSPACNRTIVELPLPMPGSDWNAGYTSVAQPVPPRSRAICFSIISSARVEFMDAAMGDDLNALLADQAAELRAAGRRPYVWHPPRTVPLATVSYVLAAAELVEDMRRIGVEPAAIYVASSGSTGAGLVLGFAWELVGRSDPLATSVGRGMCHRQWRNGRTAPQNTSDCRNGFREQTSTTPRNRSEAIMGK